MYLLGSLWLPVVSAAASLTVGISLVQSKVRSISNRGITCLSPVYAPTW